MNQQVKRWGNSLAVRLPAHLAAELGLSENDKVTISRDGDGVRIEKAAFDDPSLDELLSRITPESIHPETDWGPAVGKEVW